MKTKPLFTNDQIKRAANILDNIGQVFLASVVILAILGASVDMVNSKMVALVGTVASLFCWWVSLRLERISS